MEILQSILFYYTHCHTFWHGYTAVAKNSVTWQVKDFHDFQHNWIEIQGSNSFSLSCFAGSTASLELLTSLEPRLRWAISVLAERTCSSRLLIFSLLKQPLPANCPSRCPHKTAQVWKIDHHFRYVFLKDERPSSNCYISFSLNLEGLENAITDDGRPQAFVHLTICVPLSNSSCSGLQVWI